ncbi:MAG: hypothetical protein KUA43_19350 [Hoeflea sp.]|uniref:hypothetical protein n=1 Tax=Hoeflea sp. TaxID=1940281 RepID=UPI001D23944A|nr:hypothetical protein [Hoeflea sp.]MBU4527323.1 hypothetical protein [Alphaproteobacteria bacterium]MBU4546894.1 hypothetical protein [Alphaproteobacteria bacterium]MBU4551594.1 hypothetical protein [Alphaproteobacteria bacterium]MBV1725599.1 hypothetical protein [Hoeflea sp.]MBV1759647.1 hypothetical protein [Hoeflea sp.]
MGIFKTTLAAAAVSMVLSPAFAQTAKPDVHSLVTPAVVTDMRQWIETEIVRISIKAQNDRYQKLNQETIDALDAQWVAERESDDKPLIAATLSNPLSVYLSRLQGRSLGLYAEIFVMDQNGLNVGQSSITSDFWQGDEAKFQKTYDVSHDALFIDEPEWDEDSKIWRAQVNFTVTDDDSTTKIGAVTMEVNLTELQRRSSPGA